MNVKEIVGVYSGMCMTCGKIFDSPTGDHRCPACGAANWFRLNPQALGAVRARFVAEYRAEVAKPNSLRAGACSRREPFRLREASFEGWYHDALIEIRDLHDENANLRRALNDTAVCHALGDATYEAKKEEGDG